MNKAMVILSLTGWTVICSNALGQGSQDPAPIPAGVMTISLEEFLEPIAEDLDLDFLIDLRSRHEIYVGRPGIEDITYPILLSILRNNQLVAIEIEGRVNILPDSFARQMPIPLVQEDDPNVADDEIVSRVIQMNSINAAQVIPVLRPLLPQYAHLAVVPELNTFIIVDRYANVRRITELLNALDN